jgi:hypothetical protein
MDLRSDFLSKNKKGYIALVAGLLILFLSILNFVNFDVKSGSFIQSNFGIFEPFGTLVCIFISISLIGIALNFTWNIALKKVVKIYIVSIIGIALLPVILILFHIGEL